MTYRGVLFDLDGLLIDSEVWIEEAWKQALQESGMAMTHAQFIPLVGVGTREIGRIFEGLFGVDEARFEQLYARRSQLLMEMYRHQLTAAHLKPGAAELLHLLQERGIPRALATLCRRPFMEVMLERTGIQGMFLSIVCAEDVTRPKPEPDIFLEAARRLGVPAAECIVLEDSSAGITAAHRAGSLPILVPDLLQPPPEVVALAHAQYASLVEAGVEVCRLLGLP